MPIATPAFRVFISSTFEDLTAERDALERDVFRTLSAWSRLRGVRFQAIDLRWGVSEEAALDQRTMEVCLAEIQRCHQAWTTPGFIILLGDRYGWCPLPARIEAGEFEMVKACIASEDERSLVESWYERDNNARPAEYLLSPRRGEYVDPDRWATAEQDLREALRAAVRTAGLAEAACFKYEASATHQEIVQGLDLARAERGAALAFLPRSNEAHDPAEVRGLKAFVRARLPGRVFSYAPHDPADLCKEVGKRLEAIVADETSRFDPRRALDFEIAAHDAFAERISRQFIGRDETLHAIGEALADDDPRPIVLHGRAGSGKSALVAMTSGRAAAAAAGAVVIRRFIGISPESSNGPALLQGVARHIAREYGRHNEAPADPDEPDGLMGALALATPEQPLLVFVDALDQLDPADAAATLRWLPAKLPAHCRVLVSASEILPPLRNAKLIEVPPFRTDEAEVALSTWLAAAGRTLQPGQREAILAAFRRCSLPLYLRLAFEEARRWRSFDPLQACLPGEGLDGVIDGLFDRLSEQRNHGRVGRGLGYLAAARHGLTEDEILDVLTADEDIWIEFSSRARHAPPERRLPMILWSRLHLDLEEYLTERDAEGAAVVAFYHRQLSARFLARQDARELAGMHLRLATLFLKGADPGGDGTWAGSRRAMAEVPYHLAAASREDEVEGLLRSVPYLDARCGLGDVHGVLADLASLAQRSEAIREMHGFVRARARLLGAGPGALFGLVQHEGPPAAREAAERLLRAERWRMPWLRTTPVHLPAERSGDGGMHVSVVARHDIAPSAAVGLAERHEVMFHLERLGRVGMVDARAMEALDETLAIPPARVLGLFPSPDGRRLAVALVTGELVLYRLEFSPERRLVGQEEIGRYPYRVPEYEWPVIGWNEHQMLFQRPDGSLALLEHGRMETVERPREVRGELSGAVFTRGGWIAAIRQAGGTLVWRRGSADILRVPAGDATAAARSEGGDLVIGFSDFTIRLVETVPSLREIRSVPTGHVPSSVGMLNGGLVWADDEGLWFQADADAGTTPLQDEDTLFSSTTLVRLRRLEATSGGGLLAVGDSVVCRLAPAAMPREASHPLVGVLVDADDAIYAIQKRGEDLRLVYCDSQQDLLLVREARTRHFHALDGRGGLLTMGSDGRGTRVDLATRRLRAIRGPLGLNSLISHEGTFWLASRTGGIYRLTEGDSLEQEARISHPNLNGGRLCALEGWMVWQGRSTLMNAGNPHADVQDCLQFFRLPAEAPRLKESGLRSFPKTDGRLQVLLSGGPGSTLLALFGGHDEFDQCVKVGTPEAFLQGGEKTLALDRDVRVISAVLLAEERALYLLWADHRLSVVDLDTLRTRCRLAASRPFTSIAGNGRHGVVAVEGGRWLYRCRVEGADDGDLQRDSRAG